MISVVHRGLEIMREKLVYVVYLVMIYAAVGLLLRFF